MGMLDDVKSKKKQKAAENWMKMGDSAKTIEKQIEYYTKSLDIDPYNAQAWFKKGKGLEKLGRFEEAKKSFDLAVEIDPDYQGLVDKKYEPSVSSEPQIADETEFVEESSAPVVEETSNDEEQWIEEDLQPVSEEIQTPQKDEFGRADEYSFRPPSGEESAFSNIFIGEDDDNGTPLTDKEKAEDVEEENLFSTDHKASSLDNEPETISGGSYIVGREEVNEEGNKEESEKENERDLPFPSSGYVEAEKETLPERDMSPEEQGVFKKEDVAVAEEAIDGSTDKTIGMDDIINKTAETGTVDTNYGYVEEKQEIRDGNENTFISSPAGVPKAAPYSAAYDENVISGRKPERPVSEKIPVSGEHAGAAIQNKQAAGYDASSGTITTPRSVATSGAGPVDIRIPLSEAIKFWAIGIVAMLIVLIISSVL
ncbi:MAG: tetratricopeptide repeat protein [Methanolobus sp.]|nr:tetratricopeptide repeat protein [Methanolobus sp.]